MSEIFIPAKTLEELSAPHGKGERHAAMLKIALPLIGNGMTAQAVFDILRGKFPDADKTDKEIRDVVDYCISKNPSPSGYGAAPVSVNRGSISFSQSQRSQVAKRPPADHAAWWLSKKELTVEQFMALSQLAIPETPGQCLRLTLETLYQGTDNINIVCRFIEDKENHKARPSGGGKILTRDGWLKHLSESDFPQSAAGAWVRPNPCKYEGSGKDGAVMDSDVVAFRFLLVESDVLPMPVQLALFSKLKLPIAAVITSGGASAHAWVRLDCKTDSEYAETARRILAALAPFGIDQSNKNPSRLSRLPGAVRQIGATGDGMQQLLWLNPNRPALTSAGLKLFEDSLALPALEEKPFKRFVHEALLRYEELHRDGNKAGVPTGISDFDHDTGGLHAGHMTVIAAETNGGKTSLAMNFLYGALKSGHGAALFTLEMLNEEIVDLFFAMHCQVNRNGFNTGKFTESELASMVRNCDFIANLPLFSYDDSSLTVAQIRQRILTLKAENLISLAIVDYAQIVTPENYELNREQQVAGVARGLCACAKDARIPLIVLSQVNDDNKLRESRVLAHEAHNVIIIENKEMENKMLMKVVKGRRIQKKIYELYYKPSFCQIASLSQPD